MLGQDVLMARALRYSVDKHGLTTDALKNIPGSLQSQLMDLASTVAEDMNVNGL